MPGFDSDVTGGGGTLYATNVDFSGASVTSGSPKIVSNGQLLIGNAATPRIRVGTITSPSSTITVGYSAPNITLDVAASGTVVETLTGNSGGAVSPSAGNINTVGTGSITVVGNPGTNTTTTQLTGLTNHAVQVGAGTATLTQVGPSASTGQVLQNNAGADPSYSTATYPSTTTINQILFSSATNTVTGLTAANSATLVSTSTGVPVWSGTMTNGELVIGSTGATPVAATLTAGVGIAITNAAGAITIANNLQSPNYTSVDHAASPYTVLTTDYYLSVDTSAGAVTLNFPNAPTAKQVWVVKDRTGTAATSNISITTPGGTVTFDGQTTYVMKSNYGAIQLLANATPTYEVF